MSPWQPADHPADLRIVVRAGSWEDLLGEAVAALRECISGRQIASPAAVREVEAEGTDRDETWVCWWRELLRLWTVHSLLPLAAEIRQADETRVRATVRAAASTTLDLAACTEIKAVTWHEARVEETPKGWIGRVLLDV